MKLQINTDNKTITIEGTYKLKDIISLLDKLFPKKEWKDYELKAETKIEWRNPIIIEKQIPSQPYWWKDHYLCQSGLIDRQTLEDNLAPAKIEMVPEFPKNIYNLDCKV